MGGSGVRLCENGSQQTVKHENFETAGGGGGHFVCFFMRTYNEGGKLV